MRFACGKLHSSRMPDEQCSSLRPGRRSPSRRGTRFHFMFMCRDAHCASAFAKQTIARQGDLPALQQSGTLDLPAANCIRSECRTSDARPYAASREECRDEQCSSAFAKQTIARQGDLPASQRYGTLDLPAANCIRSECRTSNARPYVQIHRRSVREAAVVSGHYGSFVPFNCQLSTVNSTTP